MTTTDEELLRSRGLRVTRPRLATLVALRDEGHLTVESVRRRIHADGAQVSVQAVYDVLAALAGVGLVRRIEPAGSSARYEIRTGDNHHHLVCRGCGAIEDVDCAVGSAPCLDPGQDDTYGSAHGRGSDKGFVVDEAEVIFWGLCSRCHGHRQATEHSSVKYKKRPAKKRGQP